ncbi:TetR/AcrR family transcriptional regulator [Sporosarcina sp. Marseille-Q4063]|nr:TetR/AcrR family transcriptional regulator [Sporosarcina sp. Marseille-Q4063]QUW24066.1 TetR/AcrR family transcriptional regulator [Sporosarcina sp. Marseille-Q4063]
MMEDNNMLDEILQTEAGLTERQKKIIVAATEIFAEKGFAATSTREIAQQAGVAEGTIFRHYRTKKDLLLSIVTPTMIRLMAPLIIKDINKVLNDDYEKFEDFLRAMIENRDRFLKKNMQTIKIFVQEIPFHPELKEQFIKHVANKVLARLQEIVKHYQTNGQLINLPTTTIIRLIGSSIIGAFTAKYVIGDQGEWNDDVEMEHTIQFLLKGLTP